MATAQNSFSYLGQPVTMPDYIPKESAWLRHGPFSQWLVYASRPRKIVELGTHYGFSYFSMCEAVKSANLETACYAVDTWEGDDHAGKYGPEVYESVILHNEKYKSFSILLRKRFTDALADIPNGSVDLLHIDGRHGYDDVKDDFESWIPKLSNRAIVLFHDTEVVGRGFGVYKYWEELTSHYITLNFPHQHGLGVLFYGSEFTPEIRALIDQTQTDQGRSQVVNFFSLTGENFISSARFNDLSDILNAIENQTLDSLRPQRRNKEISTFADRVSTQVIGRQRLIENLNNHINNDKITSDRLARIYKSVTIKNKSLTDVINRAGYILKNPFKHRALRALARIAIKLPNLKEETKSKLRRSIDKRRYRDIVALSTTATEDPNASAEGQIFSIELSEAWKRQLHHEMNHVIAKANIRVSIVMPTRNRCNIIPRAIKSVLSQTYQNWELLIVDDGSTDGTPEAIRTDFPDDRIKIVKSSGKGVCAARNTALGQSTGQFIAYLDDDNQWASDHLEIALMQMARTHTLSSYSVLLCLPNGFDEADNFHYKIRPFDIELLKCSNFIDMNVFIHHRSLYEMYGGFDVSLKRMVDWDLIIRYCKNSPPTVCNAVGASYDASSRGDRITVKEPISYQQIIRSKHLVNWNKLEQEIENRDSNLCSIIICVYNNPELTEKCLYSLIHQDAGAEFEIILVDNGSSIETRNLLQSWTERESRIRLLINPENLNFAFGNNIGFAASRGEKVVFLNNDTEVTPEWLGTLLAPLADPQIRGVQPKLLYPDGTIQGIGLVFSDYSPFAYSLYLGRPGDDILATKRRKFKALTAACLALRSKDFIAAKGFDGIFVNGQEDVDLCLRIGGGENVFTCAPDAVVIHHEGKTAGRGAAIPENRAAFAARWTGKVKGDDFSHYLPDGVIAENFVADNAELDAKGISVYRPSLRYPNLKFPAIKTAVNHWRLRIPCDNKSRKYHWGDYHFAVAMARSVAAHGISVTVDFLPDWQKPAGRGEVDIVLRGLSKFKPQAKKNGNKSIMWMISHPDKVTDDEIVEYDHVFVASNTWADTLATRLIGTDVSALLQCTENERFNFDARQISAPKSDILYVANSRRVLRSSVEKAIREGVRLDIYGEMWEGLAPSEWVIADSIANVSLPSYYAAANVVINDHWTTMRENGFVSNRIFDVLATGTPLITDSVKGMPHALQDACTVIEDYDSLASTILLAKSKNSLSERRDISNWVVENHSFPARVREIVKIL